MLSAHWRLPSKIDILTNIGYVLVKFILTQESHTDPLLIAQWSESFLCFVYICMFLCRMFPSSNPREKKRNCLGCSPTQTLGASWVVCSARPSCWIPTPFTLPFFLLLVLGSRFSALTEKTSLERGLKGSQTNPDRWCLAADVTGWWFTVHRSGRRRGWWHVGV